MEPKPPPGPQPSDIRPPQQEQHRVRPPDVEAARMREVSAYSELMDTMEASVDTQGEYFVKLGQKKPITESRQEVSTKLFGLGKTVTEREHTIGYEDDRALLLKSTRIRNQYGTDREEFIVVTPEGIFIAPFNHSDIDNPVSGDTKRTRSEYDMLNDLVKGTQQPDASSKYEKSGTYSWGGPRLRLKDSQMAISLQEFPKEANVSEEFQKTVQESIELIESPHKTNLERAQQNATMAQDAANSIRNLPPRT